jgi:hypothetical protein
VQRRDARARAESQRHEPDLRRAEPPLELCAFLGIGVEAVGVQMRKQRHPRVLDAEPCPDVHDGQRRVEPGGQRGAVVRGHAGRCRSCALGAADGAPQQPGRPGRRPRAQCRPRLLLPLPRLGEVVLELAEERFGGARPADGDGQVAVPFLERGDDEAVAAEGLPDRVLDDEVRTTRFEEVARVLVRHRRARDRVVVGGEDEEANPPVLEHAPPSREQAVSAPWMSASRTDTRSSCTASRSEPRS